VAREEEDADQSITGNMNDLLYVERVVEPKKMTAGCDLDAAFELEGVRISENMFGGPACKPVNAAVQSQHVFRYRRG
jgi:hypothetical protein